MGNERPSTGSACVKAVLPVLDLLSVTLSRMCFYRVTTSYMEGLNRECIRICVVRNIRLSCEIEVLSHWNEGCVTVEGKGLGKAPEHNTSNLGESCDRGIALLGHQRAACIQQLFFEVCIFKYHWGLCERGADPGVKTTLYWFYTRPIHLGELQQYVMFCLSIFFFLPKQSYSTAFRTYLYVALIIFFFFYWNILFEGT